jgi:microcystin-dependent protein
MEPQVNQEMQSELQRLSAAIATLQEEAAQSSVQRRTMTRRQRWLSRALASVLVIIGIVAAKKVIADSGAIPGEPVPHQIPYRGVLGLNGAPVTDPSGTTLQFDLFNSATGGTSLWTEMQSGIPVLNGAFSVELGDVTPIPPSVFNNPTVYLGITVNGTLLAGRQRILTTPYSQKAAFAVNGVPPGSVSAYAVATSVPSGWLLCDGTQYNISDYPTLGALLGNTYGGDGSTTFNVPDYRGFFLRGYDPNGTVDTDAQSRKPSNAVGSTETDELALHNHHLTDPGHSHGLPSAYSNPTGPGTISAFGGGGDAFGTFGATTGITIAATGGSETRPKNIAVNYIIKE